MDPIVYSPFPPPSFGSVFLPFRYWTTPSDRVQAHMIETWARRPYVVGVA